MTNVEIILSALFLTFVSTAGVYVAIKHVNLYTRTPVNTLHRGSDIELVDYIAPTRPQQIYNYPDLESQFQINENVSNLYSKIPSIWSGTPPSYGRIPSYWSGTPPSYHTMDRLNINCCLEKNINQYFNEILWLIFLSIIIAFIIYFIIYFKQTKTSVFSNKLSLLILTVFCTNLLMNSLDVIYAMTLLFPFSVFDVDYRDSFEWKVNSFRVKPIISYLKLLKLTEDITKLLNSLDHEENYSLGLSFIHNYTLWIDNKELLNPLFIDDPIIINKESDPTLITQFIMNNLNDKCYFISDSLKYDSKINSIDSVILAVCVPIKVEI